MDCKRRRVETFIARQSGHGTAAKATGGSRTSILRAIEKGKIEEYGIKNWETDDNRILFDELLRKIYGLSTCQEQCDFLNYLIDSGKLRVATPWRVFRLINSIRSLLIFQDTASLSASPDYRVLCHTVQAGESVLR